ncbi:fimbrial protein [Acinetobacter guillouiae]
MNKLTLPIWSVLALTLTCSSAFAVDGTIRVNGVITDGTCILQGEGTTTGLKDLTLTLPTVPKSIFDSLFEVGSTDLRLYLSNAEGTGRCDAVTTQAFKGIHLGVTSPAEDLHETYTNLLVNKASDASNKNPIFIRFYTSHEWGVDFAAVWGNQAKSPIESDGTVTYRVMYYSRLSGASLAAQNVQATVNYTLHYN